jgi:hypothetical protein
VPGSVPDSPARTDAQRTVLIERCDGTQIGERNVQYNFHRVELTDPRVELSDRFVRELLDQLDLMERTDRQANRASGSAFRDARGPRIDQASSGRPRASGRQSFPDERGNTLIIIKDSRGTQTGRGATQVNNYSRRVTEYKIIADRLDPTPRQLRAMRRLRDNPRDSRAIRELAEEISERAERYMKVRVERELARDIGSPRQLTWQWCDRNGQCSVRDERSCQIGAGNRSYTEQEVRPPIIDRTPMKREIREIARRPGRGGRSRLPTLQ